MNHFSLFYTLVTLSTKFRRRFGQCRKVIHVSHTNNLKTNSLVIVQKVIHVVRCHVAAVIHVKKISLFVSFKQKNKTN